MADIPDFTTKTRSIDPMAIANILQRKAEMEQQQRQFQQTRRDQQMAHITDAIEAGQRIAGNMMNLAEKRNQQQGLKDLTGLMSQPDPALPAPTASSTAVPEAGTFPVRPSPEQMDTFNNQVQQRQKDFTSALAKANPDEFTKFASKRLFGQDKSTMSNLEQKDVLVDGQRTTAAFDPKTATYYDVNTKQPIQGKISPIIPAAEDTEITDKDRQELGGLADAIAEGRATPAALVNARGPRKEKLTRIMAERHPDFDLSLAPQRIAVRKDFASGGKSGQALNSLNTVIGHLDTLSSAADKLDNKAVPKYNTIQNYVKNNIGKPEVKQFNAAKIMVISELGKVAQGSGVVTNDERKQFDDQVSAASSPEQVKGVTETWIDLIKSRTDALKQTWGQTMGELPSPTPFINGKSKKILQKHGYNPDTLEKQDSGSTDKADAFFQALLRK